MEVARFDRRFFTSDAMVSRIGAGSLGGKAEGLIRISRTLAAAQADGAFPMPVTIPRLVVLATDVFDAFMADNRLAELVTDDVPDDRVAHAFQQAHLPTGILGDLRAVAAEVRQPLAVRSSSLLEDALDRPFAGVYETKMIPNNQPDPNARFQRLTEAIKLVYASTYLANARDYRRAAGIEEGREKMAVMIQEVVGARHGDRHYPDVSAVCRSYSYYPVGSADPDDGVVSLALGLGKSIVDGGLCWSYAPSRPKAAPPFASPRQMLDETQTRFWAVNMGRPPAYDPIAETEYLVEAGLEEAEYDGTLSHAASTYDAASDRLRPGVSADGPRVLDFAPVLQHRTRPLNETVVALLRACEGALEGPVEIELACNLAGSSPRVGFVQVRPMRAPGDEIDVSADDLTSPGLLCASDRTMGNGEEAGLTDVVYVRPESFEARHTPAIAGEIAALNRRLVDAGRPYVLVGFGRWGSSDPWLGIPVSWGQVAGARVLVEATLPAMDVEPSQGSHFFHNLSNTGVLYFAVRHDRGASVDWAWLDGQSTESESDLVRHVRTPELTVRVDGRTGRGLIRRASGED